MPIRMEIEGIRCAGGVPGYQGTYELYDVKIQAARPVLGPPTFSGVHEALPARLGVVEVTPDWRRSTRSLFAWAMDGERRDVTIHWLYFDRADFGRALTVTLSGAWLWEYSLSANGGSNAPPMETLCFAFDELTYVVEQGGAFTCTVRPPLPDEGGDAAEDGEADDLTTPGMLAEALRRWPTDALLWSALGDYLEESGGVAGVGRAREEAKALGDGGAWWGEVEPT